MKKIILKRAATSFCISAMCGMLVNLLVELIVRQVTGDTAFVPLSPEYRQCFPSDTIAMEINVLLYGVIGAAFSAATVVYEWDRIGFLIQNLIYFLLTGLVWVPIVTLLWQLVRYPEALISTLTGFVATYIIMSIVGYRIIRRDVGEINKALAGQNS